VLQPGPIFKKTFLAMKNKNFAFLLMAVLAAILFSFTPEKQVVEEVKHYTAVNPVDHQSNAEVTEIVNVSGVKGAKLVTAKYAAATEEGHTVKVEETTDYFQGVQGTKRYLLTFGTGGLDTLTNAATETYTITGSLANLVSNFSYDWQCSRTNISGTTNATCTLEGSAASTGSVWATIETISGTGATVAMCRNSFSPEARHRFKVVGSGTQSTKLEIQASYKKLN
jgi:hypothetical protein